MAENSKGKVNTEMEEPLIKIVNRTDEDDLQGKSDHQKRGSLWVVLVSTFVAVQGSLQFGYCVGYSSPVQSAITEDLELSLAEYSLFGSILNVGAMIGAITSGHIGDYLGRKRAMGMAALLSFAGWVAIYFSQEAFLLDAGRILTGYGIGVSSYVVPTYIAEIAPKDSRGGLATINQIMIVMGVAIAFLLGTVATWKILALTGIVPCIVQLLGLFFIPESPRWLAKAGYQVEFGNALIRLRGDNADISSEAAEIQDYLETLRHQPKSGILDLFQRRNLYPVTIGVGLMIFQQFGGANGIGFYVSETFVSAGFSSGKIGMIAFVGIQVPVTTIGAFFMDNYGRKPLLLTSATGTFLGCFIAATAFLMKDYNLLTEWIPLCVLGGVLIFIGSFSIGMGAIPWVIMSEIFPTNIKGAAGSLVNLVHWFGAWAVSYTFNFLMAWSSSGTFYLYSGICAASILFVAKVVPETKGRTLEEIQAYMNSS